MRPVYTRGAKVKVIRNYPSGEYVGRFGTVTDEWYGIPEEIDNGYVVTFDDGSTFPAYPEELELA